MRKSEKAGWRRRHDTQVRLCYVMGLSGERFSRLSPEEGTLAICPGEGSSLSPGGKSVEGGRPASKALYPAKFLERERFHPARDFLP